MQFALVLNSLKKRNNNERLRVVTMKLEIPIVHLIDQYAMLNGITRSEVIRKVLEDFIRSEIAKGV